MHIQSFIRGISIGFLLGVLHLPVTQKQEEKFQQKHGISKTWRRTHTTSFSIR